MRLRRRIWLGIYANSRSFARRYLLHLKSAGCVRSEWIKALDVVMPYVRVRRGR